MLGKFNLRTTHSTHKRCHREETVGTLHGCRECRRYLVQVEPVPHDADEEADCKHPFELNKPGDHGPQLSADDRRDDKDTERHLHWEVEGTHVIIKFILDCVVPYYYLAGTS